eukprot:TRINITY_DN3849_c0_g2_i1.p1 TRINITY_DN3849_c0_g2~~TRINITY_DN3849_c0_g2_i1.p1  ORF type:complete len:213 (-),score=55.47 TRINITY_DN3849_c0_g2_i1:136-774(-)
MTDKTILWSYFRSSCSWRIRIALNWKGIEYEYSAVNLLQGSQLQDEYAHLNPSKVVPTLAIDGHTLRQSIAILEYLEETRPTPALLPKDAALRARVRQIVNIIASDTQPVQNLRVLKMVGEKKNEWAKHWIEVNFEGLEATLKETSGRFCVGDEVTLADVCLVPQVYNAKRFNVEMEKFPTIARIDQELSKLPEFEKAQPRNQPDRPADLDC